MEDRVNHADQIPVLRGARPARRDVLKAAAAVAGYWVLGRGAWADEKAATQPSDKVKIGLIGVGGRAAGSMAEEDNAIASQEVVAICDIDEKTLGVGIRKFPKAATYSDFRKLLERNDLDAVMVSTADHCHAPATLIALSTGKHVYCEKPLTHTVEECRRVVEVARKYKRVTQMGTQIHAGGNYRRVVELIQSGAIGPVREVHVVLGGGKPWHAGDIPKASGPVPKTLDYDLWVGPQPFREYRKEYHPENWRSFWHWGTGTLGDMGCHFIDLPFWALKLVYPTKVSAEGPPVHADGAPEWIIANWEFPQRGELPPVKLHWYHGNKKPKDWEDWGIPAAKKSGIVFIGDKGKLLADYSMHKLLPAEDFKDFKAPAKSIPDSIGHHREWLAAIRKNDPTATTCNFDYSGAVAETVLLGTVAYRTGKELIWDAKKLSAVNAPEADKFIRQSDYRKGWGMDILNTL